MSLQDPQLGFLYVEDDDDVLHTYRITDADYNVYERDNLQWLTVYCRANEKVAPLDSLNPQPWIELNVPLEPSQRSCLREGVRINGTAYDDSFGGNLTNMHYFSHGGFEDAEITIRDVTEAALTLKITGEADSSRVALCAAFRSNPRRERSIT